MSCAHIYFISLPKQNNELTVLCRYANSLVYICPDSNFPAFHSIMDGGKKVWVPHPVDGFKLGRIVDIGAENFSVELLDQPGQVCDICELLLCAILIVLCVVVHDFNSFKTL
jgi:hypothetical protein